MDAAAARGANTFCLPGGRLGAVDDFERRRNVIYSLASPRNIDAVASWTTSLSGSVPPREVEAFMARLDCLPVVSLSQAVAGHPLIAFDAYRGMRALIEHLIDAHGHDRIAFARGPESHVSAQQRYSAYRDILAERGIPFRPALVTDPLPWDAGSQAAIALLDARRLVPGKDFRAFVAASDLLAFWALKEFLARGIRVPEDLAVAGFNDSRESALSSPALTTVAIDFRGEGRAAADILLRMLGGEKVPAQTLLPAELRLRRSCGCPTSLLETPRQPQVLPAAGPGRSAFVAELASLLCVSGPNAHGAPGAVAAKASMAWLGGLVDSLSPPPGQRCGKGFLELLESALDRSSPEGLDPAGWQPVLTRLRSQALLLAGADPTRVEELFHRARALAAESSRRAETYRHWQEDQEAQALRGAGAALLASHDLPRIAAVLEEVLPRLGIPSAYLVLEDVGAKEARLVAALGQGCEFRCAEGGHAFERGLILPQGILPGTRPWAFVVEPLFFRDEAIGRLVLEIGPRDGTVYEELRAYLSSALRGAALFAEAQDARLRAEKADRIKTSLLANLSRELCEPLERIIEEARLLGSTEGPPSAAPLSAAAGRIGQEARRQLVLIEELLDLTRADIGELDLALTPLDPLALLEGLAGGKATPGLPRRLPLIAADASLLSRVFSMLAKAGEAGSGPSRISARLELPHLLIDIASPGPIGTDVSLALARRILALHGASLESLPCGFRMAFNLPALVGSAAGAALPEGGTQDAARIQALAILSRSGQVTEEASRFAEDLKRHCFPLASLEEEDLGGGVEPIALVWDLDEAIPGDWELVRALRFKKRFSSLPFLVLSSASAALVASEGRGWMETDFLGLLERSHAAAATEPVFLLSRYPGLRAELASLVSRALPGRRQRSFATADEAAISIAFGKPALLLCDPEGCQSWLSLDRGARGPEGERLIPLVVLAPDDCESWAGLVDEAGLRILPRAVLPEALLCELIARAVHGGGGLPHHSSALVRRAELWLARNFAVSFSRVEFAAAIGVNEDYLGRIFRQEMGLSPWEFLGRYRIRQAKCLLEESDESLAVLGAKVGIPDQAYFSRVFRKFTGLAPLTWRNHYLGRGEIPDLDSDSSDKSVKS